MLYEKLTEQMKEAMKSHDKETLSTIRMLKSALDAYKINNKMDRQAPVSDEDFISIASTQIKNLKENIEEYKSAGRDDIVVNLEREVNYLMTYMPEQLSSDEINNIIDAVFEDIKPQSMKDMGVIMKEITPKLKGRADMKEVNGIIKDKLNNL